MRAFISYQHQDRHIAGQVSAILESYNVDTFMAHEHIDVSEEWRLAILRELEITDFFVAILSERYESSHWCTQEAGIAAYRALTCIPLTIDTTIPPGFMQNVQAARLDPEDVGLIPLVPGLVNVNPNWAMDILVEYVLGAKGYRTAEARFGVLLPYRDRLSSEQGVRLLEGCHDNGQIHDAADCARDHLPLILEQFGQELDEEKFQFLADKVNQYREYAGGKPWVPSWML